MQEAFLVFITKISLYPTIIFTGLVMFVTLYWIVSLLGMADMDSVDLGESGGDADVSTLSSTGFFTGLMLKFGLYGVPLIIILSLISLIGWLLSYIYQPFTSIFRFWRSVLFIRYRGTHFRIGRIHVVDRYYYFADSQKYRQNSQT